MNEARYKHYWLVVMDLHNHHVEGNLRYVANPTTKRRMELIVEEHLLRQMNELVVTDNAEEEEQAERPKCKCTRKCKTNKCPCFSAKLKCDSNCHQEKRRFAMCTNEF